MENQDENMMYINGLVSGICKKLQKYFDKNFAKHLIKVNSRTAFQYQFDYETVI